MDPHDLLTELLEPGERIVWSDRPRGFGRALGRRAAGFSFWAALVIAALPDLLLLAVFVVATGRFTRMKTEDWLGMTQVLGVGALPALVLVGVNVFRAARSLHRVYAVTDRGRAIETNGRRFRVFRLPAPAAIVTPHRSAERGDVRLGREVFEDVSDPAAAAEAIRLAAKARS